jgi:uncharacterized phiE125 gp8 family phage protein
VRKRVDTYQLYKAATTIPVSVSDAKDHCRVSGSDHDSLISDLVWAAVHSFEKRANVCLSSQSWKAFLDKGYEEIEMWKYPITSISSIRYYDSDNVVQTLSTDDYYHNIDAGSTGYNPRPTFIFVEDVPSTYERDDAFIITFQAGYSSIDYDVKQALLSWVYRKYENPNDAVTERISFFDNIVEDNRSYGL